MKLSRTTPRQPFVGLTMMAVLGIIVADCWPLPPNASLWLSAVYLAAALAVLRWPVTPLTQAFVGTGFFLLHSFQIQDTPGLRLVSQLGDRPRAIHASGFVLDEPKVAPNGFATFLFKLQSIELEGQTVPTTATLFVRWRGEAQFGDQLNLFGIAEPIPPPRNPGEFDLRSYLARRDIRRGLFVRYAEDGIVVRRTGGNPILRAAHASRAWMQKVLCRSLEDSPDVQNFLSGIVLGLRHQTPEDIEEPFQQTGTLHLFAVAGLHVGIVAQLLVMVAAVARLSRRWATRLIIPLLIFYAAVTGLHVSSVRAAIMSSILLSGFFFERKVFSLNSLAAAAFLLLAWNTNELFSTGFQLSFAVVGAIVLLTDPVFLFLRRFPVSDPFLPPALVSRPRHLLTRGFEWLCGAGSVSLAAWLGSLPLIIWYFHLITPISLVANLVIVPIAFVVLAIALLSILTAPLFSWVSIVFNNANWALVRIILALVHWFAQLPAGHLYLDHPSFAPTAEAKMTVLDAGAGAAVHVRSHGADWLFDCGSERDYARVLRQYLHVKGANRIDGLLLSHGDSLHIGGAAPLLQDFVPRVLIDNRFGDRSSVHRQLRRTFATRKISPTMLTAGDTFQLAPRTIAKILFPVPGLSAATADDEALVVQLIIAGRTRVLFESDSGYATENALLASGSDLHSDMIIKGQHHSGKSGAPEFLDAVKPRLIVATSRDFPESERVPDQWADVVRARGIKLFRQDQTGAVEIGVFANRWEARAYVSGEIFAAPAGE